MSRTNPFIPPRACVKHPAKIISALRFNTQRAKSPIGRAVFCAIAMLLISPAALPLARADECDNGIPADQFEDYGWKPDPKDKSKKKPPHELKSAPTCEGCKEAYDALKTALKDCAKKVAEANENLKKITGTGTGSAMEDGRIESDAKAKKKNAKDEVKKKWEEYDKQTTLCRLSKGLIDAVVYATWPPVSPEEKPPPSGGGEQTPSGGGEQPPPVVKRKFPKRMPVTIPKLPKCFNSKEEREKFCTTTLEPLLTAESNALNDYRAGALSEQEGAQEGIPQIQANIAAIKAAIEACNEIPIPCPSPTAALKTMSPPTPGQEQRNIAPGPPSTLGTLAAGGQVKINSTGTGETIGHVADLKIENLTDQPLTCAIPPMILESGSGKNQPYACPSGQTVALNPHQTKTVPVNGVCLNRNKPPVGKGVSGDLVMNEANPAAPQNPNSHLPAADAGKLLRMCTSKYTAADQLQKSGALKNLPYHDPQKQKDIVVQWSTWCDPRISQVTGAPPATKDDLRKVVYKQLETKRPMSPETKKKVDQGIDTIFEKVELTTAKAKDLEQATGENVAPGTTFNVSNETPAEPQRQEKPKEETPSPSPLPHTEEKPKPVAGDPEGGIDIPGHGKAHRGTGTRDNPNNPNDKRAAFYLWITVSKDSKCKGYAWYQYVNVTVKFDDTDVTDTLAKDGKIKTAIGTDLVLGKWNGDYHKEDEKKQKTKPKHESMPGSNPPVDAGPYAPRPIDGTPGAEGLIDAPNWGNTGAWKELVTRLANRGKIRKKHTGEDQPPDSTFTLTITSNFRDYLYCIDPRACLGWSEETYVETLKFKLTWALSGSAGENMGAGLDKSQQVWVSTVSFVSSDSKVTFGKWNACP